MVGFPCCALCSTVWLVLLPLRLKTHYANKCHVAGLTFQFLNLQHLRNVGPYMLPQIKISVYMFTHELGTSSSIHACAQDQVSKLWSLWGLAHTLHLLATNASARKCPFETIEPQFLNDETRPKKWPKAKQANVVETFKATSQYCTFKTCGPPNRFSEPAAELCLHLCPCTIY